jgi:hypothetical protein
MKIDEFRKGVHAHAFPQQAVTAQQADAFANWLLNQGLTLFEEAFSEETAQSIPSIGDGKLIEQAYPKGLNDINSKQGQQAFYTANARVFITECRRIASNIAAAPAGPESDVFASRHHELLRKLALDGLVLLADWARCLQGVDGIYGIGKNTLHDFFQISHAADQLMFAGSSLFAFTDNATDSATALLRVAIETRLRFGFGLLGIVDKASQVVTPLNLSKVLAAVKSHESNIRLGIPLAHIERLYGWSNIYVHTGLKHYTWSPIFASRYLIPLLRGGNYPGGTGVNAGIQINTATLTAVQLEVANIYTLDPTKSELLSLEPHQCAVILL